MGGTTNLNEMDFSTLKYKYIMYIVSDIWFYIWLLIHPRQNVEPRHFPGVEKQFALKSLYWSISDLHPSMAMTNDYFQGGLIHCLLS